MILYDALGLGMGGDWVGEVKLSYSLSTSPQQFTVLFLFNEVSSFVVSGKDSHVTKGLKSSGK